MRFSIYTFLMLLCSLAGCQAVPSSQRVSDAEAERLYLDRFAALSDRTSRTGLTSYDPLGPVLGAADWSELTRVPSENRTLSQRALKEAAEFAQRNNSSTLLIWRNGVVEAEYYFGETKPESLLNSKSLAKPLGVVAIGRAIAEGHIESLDQPVADFITSWRDTPKAQILIRHLLDMRSGLLPQGPAPTADNVLNRAYLHPFHDRVIIDEYPLVHPPGQRYDYSNANSELVAPLIERSTGMSYHQWLSQQVLQPIGAQGGQIWMNRVGGTAHSGCCVLLPAETYLRLAILILQDGLWDEQRLLPEGFVTQMKTSTPQNPNAGMGLYLGVPYLERRGFANPEIPFGQVLHSEPYAADDLVVFDGNSNQVAYIVPSENLVILRTGGWPPKEPEWDNAKIPNIILRDLAAP